MLVGRYGLNPFFRLLAASGAREVMTAAALLVVLGTALLMEQVGLSMAMGAFLAGILLAESNFRHQLEADIEPFRGMLLGLFFMSVGMSIDGEPGARGLAGPVRGDAGGDPGQGRPGGRPVPAVRLDTGSTRCAAPPILAPAGEFAFVLLPLAEALGLTDADRDALRGGAGRAHHADRAGRRQGPRQGCSSVARARRGSRGRSRPPTWSRAREARVLVIGFGRFGQILTQVLLAEGIGVTVIDKDVEQIRAASRFGFRIYYGDGTRLDVLRAAGIGRVELVCICVDDRAGALKIVDIVHEEFASVRTYVRAYDRMHAVELMNRDVDYQIRETAESALAFGRAALEGLGLSAGGAAARAEDVRKRDIARLVLQQAGALPDGAGWMRGAAAGLKPEPLTAPQRARARARAPRPATSSATTAARRPGACSTKPAAPRRRPTRRADGRGRGPGEPRSELEAEGSARDA